MSSKGHNIKSDTPPPRLQLCLGYQRRLARPYGVGMLRYRCPARTYAAAMLGARTREFQSLQLHNYDF